MDDVTKRVVLRSALGGHRSSTGARERGRVWWRRVVL